MIVSQPHPMRFGALIAALTLATCAAVVVGQQNPLLALLPVAGVGLAYGIWRAPLRITLLVLLLLALTVDVPSERPGAGKWHSPLYSIGMVLFENLHKSTGIGALHFSGLDALTGSLMLLAVYRKATGRDIDSQASVQTASCLLPMLLIAFLGVAGTELWGLLRHGSFKNSLWQLRHMLYLPMMTYLFQGTFRGPSEHRLLGRFVLGAACLKALLSLYVYQVIFRPLNEKPFYATTHSDSMLYITATVMVLARWNERRDRRGWLLLTTLPLLALGMHINNRRIVYVGLVAALAVIYLIVPWNAVKRAATRAALLLLPLIPLYLAAGWNSKAKVFKPVQVVRSVVSAEADRSTATREIENFNLYWTLKQSPLLGTGFGHEYIELVRADDISHKFPQYRYIPHNSILALWAFGGLVGFTAVWLPLIVGMFLAVRSYRHARAPDDRAAALTCIAVFIAFASQAYGDMGLQSWMGVFLVSTALAVSGKLAVAVGAWPALARRPRDAVLPDAAVRTSLPPPARTEELSA